MIREFPTNVTRLPLPGPGTVRIQGGLLTSMMALAAVAVAAPPPLHHAQGEMAGEVTATGVLLQSRLTAVPGPDLAANGDIPGASGEACFEWATDAEFLQPHRTPWLAATPDRDCIVRTRLVGLTPATTHHYRLVIGRDSAATRVGPTRRFRTLPPPDSTAPLSFTMGSCQNYDFFMHGHNGRRAAAPATDRSRGFPAYAAMRSLSPAFFIGTGDIVYYDHPAATPARTLPEMRRKWHEQFRFPRMIEFLGNTAAYWSKDDHDFRFNDADREGNLLPTATTGIDVFREQMPMLDAGDRTSPTYRTHRVHRHLQLWFTEGRDYRSPNTHPDGPHKTLWGGAQREWLERTLLDSDATWRVIVSPTPMVGPDTDRKRDNHANPDGFRHECETFFEWTVSRGIGNLLVFCGDRHWHYHSIHPSGIEEFGCGAINDENAVAGVRPGTRGSSDPGGLIKQPFLSDKLTGGFLHVTVDEEAGAARLRVEFVDDEGTVMHANSRRARR